MRGGGGGVVRSAEGAIRGLARGNVGLGLLRADGNAGSTGEVVCKGASIRGEAGREVGGGCDGMQGGCKGAEHKVAKAALQVSGGEVGVAKQPQEGRLAPNVSIRVPLLIARACGHGVDVLDLLIL